MADFPTITRKPSAKAYEEGFAFDPTLRSKMEGGYVVTRAKATRVPQKFSVEYAALPTVDKDLIKAHEDAVKVGAEAFDWLHPATLATYSVRYTAPVKYSPADDRMSRWKVSFVLEEV
jgi:hypothetical protein